ncbi:hypothetical protein IQ278_12110 [Tolypothrix sp. LEGE 11397]|uniref:hypothetical protein n=1 Tax=Tolypothrix sp. LEGE 11397 TaxID=2777971 RepID=UPI0018808A7C|nr:hypothetical protein [Tolypothrix sp. LEGE 11397]MBE9082858.1 hypothetical protein [Tolypothrix sp. LEGE 11397]
MQCEVLAAVIAMPIELEVIVETRPYQPKAVRGMTHDVNAPRCTGKAVLFF